MVFLSGGLVTYINLHYPLCFVHFSLHKAGMTQTKNIKNDFEMKAQICLATLAVLSKSIRAVTLF